MLFFSVKSAGGRAISLQKTSCCLWVATPGELVNLHCYACGVDGARRVRDYQFLSDALIIKYLGYILIDSHLNWKNM